MDNFLNILDLFFMASSALGWLAVIFLCWFYWMCQRPPKE